MGQLDSNTQTQDWINNGSIDDLFPTENNIQPPNVNIGKKWSDGTPMLPGNVGSYPDNVVKLHTINPSDNTIQWGTGATESNVNDTSLMSKIENATTKYLLYMGLFLVLTLGLLSLILPDDTVQTSVKTGLELGG